MTLRKINIDQAKVNLSTLVDAAAAEEIVLARKGRRVDRLLPYPESPRGWHGRGFASDPDLIVPDDFDNPLPEDVLTSFSK